MSDFEKRRAEERRRLQNQYEGQGYQQSGKMKVWLPEAGGLVGGIKPPRDDEPAMWLRDGLPSPKLKLVKCRLCEQEVRDDHFFKCQACKKLACRSCRSATSKVNCKGCDKNEEAESF